MSFLLVALGAAAGAPTRYVLAHLLDARLPWGTILVNVVGSFFLGLFSGLSVDGGVLALLGTGFCGALTTYSAFTVQTHALGPRLGALNVVLSVVPALAACGLGFWLGSAA
ncbi:MAG: CrcB family protein [Actinomycetota bacterium]|nr:CrcB family protein [Actinomycetota bacterium]